MEMGSDLNEMSARIGIAARFPEEQGAACPIYEGVMMTYGRCMYMIYSLNVMEHDQYYCNG